VISAQVSIYPLRQEHLSPAIEAVRRVFERHDIHPQVGAMSTVVTGDEAEVFPALQEAFVTAAATGHVVMTITVSNACPV
jgi:uncharacterized protein YqgV (UPF0045/DUF77 family)